MLTFSFLLSFFMKKNDLVFSIHIVAFRLQETTKWFSTWVYILMQSLLELLLAS